MNRPKVLTALLFASLLVLAGCNRESTSNGGGEAPEAARQADHGAHEGEGASHQEPPEGRVEMGLEAQRQAALVVVPARVQRVPTLFTTTGEFQANADRLAQVKPQGTGRVVRVLKTVGEAVREGEPLALVQSAELGEAQAAFLEAQAKADLAQEGAVRQRKLFAEELTARKEVVAAENALRVARLDVERRRQQLRTLGLSDERIQGVASQQRIEATVPLVAPIGGVVTEKHLTLGQTLEPGAADPAFVIVDTSSLWVNANLYEKDLAQVREGHVAEVSTPAYPGRRFRGRVALISPTLDKETRTAKARIVVANPERLLRPEMFATVRLQTGARQAVAIPASAVMQDQSESYVFVQQGETTFEKRPVELEAKSGELVPVRAGLAAGERVVTTGAFTLKAELLKESFGEHEH